MFFGRRKRHITRVLIVEDEPLVAFDTEYLLAEEKYEVVATLDRVADAVAIIASGQEIHLLLVDMSLADGSGTEVARAAQARAIPVLFVTGHAPDGEEAQRLATGWLSKPFQQRDLLRAVEAIDQSLAGRAPRRLPDGFQLFASGGTAPLAG